MIGLAERQRARRGQAHLRPQGRRAPGIGVRPGHRGARHGQLLDRRAVGILQPDDEVRRRGARPPAAEPQAVDDPRIVADREALARHDSAAHRLSGLALGEEVGIAVADPVLVVEVPHAPLVGAIGGVVDGRAIPAIALAVISIVDASVLWCLEADRHVGVADHVVERDPPPCRTGILPVEAIFLPLGDRHRAEKGPKAILVVLADTIGAEGPPAIIDGGLAENDRGRPAVGVERADLERDAAAVAPAVVARAAVDLPGVQRGAQDLADRDDPARALCREREPGGDRDARRHGLDLRRGHGVALHRATIENTVPRLDVGIVGRRPGPARHEEAEPGRGEPLQQRTASEGTHQPDRLLSTTILLGAIALRPACLPERALGAGNRIPQASRTPTIPSATLLS